METVAQGGTAKPSRELRRPSYRSGEVGVGSRTGETAAPHLLPTSWHPSNTGASEHQRWRGGLEGGQPAGNPTLGPGGGGQGPEPQALPCVFLFCGEIFKSKLVKVVFKTFCALR